MRLESEGEYNTGELILMLLGIRFLTVNIKCNVLNKRCD